MGVCCCKLEVQKLRLENATLRELSEQQANTIAKLRDGEVDTSEILLTNMIMLFKPQLVTQIEQSLLASKIPTEFLGYCFRIDEVTKLDSMDITIDYLTEVKSAANFVLEMTIAGKPYVQCHLESDRPLHPDLQVQIRGLKLKFQGALTFNFDAKPRNVELAFLRTPDLDMELDIDFSGLPVPGESFVLPPILAQVLARHDVTSPLAFEIH